MSESSFGYQLLVEENQRLEDELATLKITLATMEETLEEVTTERDSLRAQLVKAIDRLVYEAVRIANENEYGQEP